jgi:uncharacterized protein with von Willebrand factor type A (vWA) domain
MARERKTVKVSAVVDESGSMGYVQATTISSFDEFLTTLKETPGDLRVSLTIFDDEVRHPYEEEYLANAKGLGDPSVAYNALSGGGTALYDAFGAAIERHARRAAEATLIIMVVITDGDDTSSREWNAGSIKAEVDKKKATGKWRFIWMGPNQKTARDVGINPDDIFELKSGSEGIKGAIAQMSEVVETLLLTAGSAAS